VYNKSPFVVVAASNSKKNTRVRHKAVADYVCRGVNDHVEIQAALDSLLVTGGEVLLLDGTYNCEATINIDTNQTLKGCGRNTVLTTSTANLVFLSAVGGAGTEKTGIVIADLQIDGATVSDAGIYFEYVDYSIIHNVYSRRHLYGFELEYLDNDIITNNTCEGNSRDGINAWELSNNIISGNICQGNAWDGMDLYEISNNSITGNICQGNSRGMFMTYADGDTITGNTCQGNSNQGIALDVSDNCTITGNTCHGNYLGIEMDTLSNAVISGNNCQGNTEEGIYVYSLTDSTVSGNTCKGNSWGIYLDTSSNNTVTGNTCQGNNLDGIFLEGSDNNTIVGNTCQGNNYHGIFLYYSDNNTVSGNTLTENSQGTTNTRDDIHLETSDYNNIQGNTCRAGALVKKPRYGINISNVACDGNLVTNNDIHDDGFATGSLNDAGAGTVTVAGNRV